MLLRCAGMAVTGMVFAAGVATGAALGGGAVAAAVVGREMWRRRTAWRDGGAGYADDHLDAGPMDPGMPPGDDEPHPSTPAA